MREEDRTNEWVGERCKGEKSGGRNSSNETRRGEILRMKVDKSEEGPGVSSQTETCPFDSRIARSFHHHPPFPSTTRNDRKFGNLTLRSRLAWFLRGHFGVSLPDITLPANEIVLPYNCVVTQPCFPHHSFSVPFSFLYRI